MVILLHSNRTVEEVKEAFNNSFPYLKIVFSSKKKQDGSAVCDEVDPDTRLVGVSGIVEGVGVDIKSTDTVKQVEQTFERLYGLPVHIFRQQKGIWMDTSVTDDLTLQEQNTWGRESSKPLKIKVDDNLNRNIYR